jgi:glycosyltransferase involved in cell wall biosynthesis
MKSTKIVQLTSVHSPFDLRILTKECASLARFGYDVVLIARHPQDEQAGEVRIKGVSSPSVRLGRFVFCNMRMFREALRQNAEVYHFHDPELILLGLLLRIKGKKVVYDLHEDLPRTIRAKFYIPSLLRPPLASLIELIENAACRKFTGLVPATPAIAERFSSINTNIAIVRNYPIIEDITPLSPVSWKDRDRAVIYAGGITRERGIFEMVEAMSLLSQDLGVRLKLPGRFWSKTVRDEAVQLPGWDKVDEFGWVGRKQMSELLRRSRVGLMVLHPSPNHLRSEPVKLFEYMCAAMPVIVSDFPLWREIVGGAKCGLIVPPANAGAIAQAIDYLFSHPEEAEEMGRRGREAVTKLYNWNTEELQLFRFYVSIAGEPNRRDRGTVFPRRVEVPSL